MEEYVYNEKEYIIKWEMRNNCCTAECTYKWDY